MSKSLQSRELYDFGVFRLDAAERALTKNGQIVPLTPKAFDTLVVLLRNSGHVVEKDELLKQVWPDTFVEEGVLAVNVAALRKALNEGDEGRSYIETVPRRGYRFIGEVQALRRSPADEAAQESERRKKSSTRQWGLTAGLLAIVLAGFGWFISRSRPSSIPPPSPPVPLTSYPGTELSPTFSPDGSQVAFTWNGPQQDNFDIYAKVVDRDDLVRLTRDPAVDRKPAWSPDGRRIAFIRDGTVFVISPLGGRETKVADLDAVHIEWTKDGRSLVVSAGQIGGSRLLLLSVETGATTKELTSPSRKNFVFGDRTFAISPDGLKIAFARFYNSSASDLYVMPLAGGEPIQLTRNERTILGVTWTSDGRELVYASDRATSNWTLWRRSVEAPVDSPSIRVESAGPNARQPVIQKVASGSQDRLAYATVILDNNIWTRDTEESSSRDRKVIASSQDEGTPQFSPDGRRIAFSSDRSGITQIYVADRDGTNVLPLTSFSAGFTNAPRWSPDGKRIVFASLHNNNRELYTVSADGSSLRQLTRTSSNEGRPSWSRDGRWIYFYCDRTGQELIWRIPAEGGEMIQVTKGRGHESFESTDGKLLYFEDYGVKGLQSISTERTAWPGEGTLVLPSVRQAKWAVAEKGIYYVKFDDRSVPYGVDQRLFAPSSVHPIMFYDFRTRKEAQIGAIGRELGSFSVTSDGRTIAWSQVDNAEGDIMMIENFR